MRVLLTVGLAGLVVLAGCVESESSADASDLARAEGPNSGGDGGIRGSVISDEFFPVPDAPVEVVGGPATTTDESGQFQLPNVAAGTQTLRVNATGYEPAELVVESPVNGFTEVMITLTGLPGQSPYVTRLQYEGYNACSYTLVYSGSSTNPYFACPFGASKSTYRVEVGGDWRAGVHEMAWKTQEQMTFLSTKSQNGCRTATAARPADDCPAFIWGKSPLRVFARPNDVAYAKKYSLNGTQTWPASNHTSFLFGSYQGFFRDEINRTAYPVCAEVNRRNSIPEHWGCPLGVGYSTGIRFTFYHTTFYLQAPLRLEEFSAIPDG